MKKLTKIEETADRYIRNFSTSPHFHGTVNKQELEQIFDYCGGEVFCNGHLRVIDTTPITDNMFSIKTIPFK